MESNLIWKVCAGLCTATLLEGQVSAFRVSSPRGDATAPTPPVPQAGRAAVGLGCLSRRASGGADMCDCELVIVCLAVAAAVLQVIPPQALGQARQWGGLLVSHAAPGVQGPALL